MPLLLEIVLCSSVSTPHFSREDHAKDGWMFYNVKRTYIYNLLPIHIQTNKTYLKIEGDRVMSQAIISVSDFFHTFPIGLHKY